MEKIGDIDKKRLGECILEEVSMPSISLKDAKFELYNLGLERDESLPSEMRIRLRVEYDKAVFKKDEKHEIEMTPSRGLGVYILHSRGYLEFRSSISQKSVRIKCGIRDIWQSNVKKLEIVSYPLNHKDIHELEQIDGDQLQIYWSIDCLVFLENPTNYELEPGTLVSMYVGSGRSFEISRLDLVRRILEPADLLRRRFIEVIVEPIRSDELDKIPDSDVREALRLLLNKQSLLQDALDRLIRANRSSDYRSVLEDVRKVVEELSPESRSSSSQRLFEALKKAFKSIGIADEIDQGALDIVVEELSDIVIGKFILNGLFKHASKLGSHVSKAGKDLERYKSTQLGKDYQYIPKPYKHDAEFGVLQAMVTLNYLIRILKAYAQRL